MAIELKLVSLNLWHGGKLFDEIVEFLQREQPDVVMMQEVYGSPALDVERRLRSVPALRKQLDYPYHHFAPAFLAVMDDGKVEQGNAVLSRLPINRAQTALFGPPYREVRDIPEEWPTEPRNIEHLVLQASSDTEVNLLNFQGVWDLDGNNDSAGRREMSAALVTCAKSKRNVILAGDTNAKPTNPAMRALEHYLKPVFGPELKTTFNMRRKDNPGYATAAVDLMYVSPQIEILERDCPDVDVSDHRPLVVRLRLPE